MAWQIASGQCHSEEVIVGGYIDCPGCHKAGCAYCQNKGIVRMPVGKKAADLTDNEAREWIALWNEKQIGILEYAGGIGDQSNRYRVITRYIDNLHAEYQKEELDKAKQKVRRGTRT